MATDTINFGGGMLALPGRQGWGLVDDPGHEQLRTYGELGGIPKYADAPENKGAADAATLIAGNGAPSLLPATSEAPKRTLGEFLDALANGKPEDLIKNRDSLYSEYQGLLGDVKDPVLRAILAKLFMALLSDPPDIPGIIAAADKIRTYVAVQDFLSGKSNQVPPEVMRLLESKYGKWNGIGKNVDPTKGTGPNGGRLLRESISSMLEGNDQKAQSSYNSAQKTASPIVLDLTGKGKIGTTGDSTAKVRNGGQVGKTVSFDIDGNGTKDQIEWLAGDGAGMLVDDSDGGATAAAAGNGEIDGKRLFGDEGGKFASGYDKLAKFDADGNGTISGDELKNLKIWVDDGDARVGAGELRTAAELGITEISVSHGGVQNERGETLDRSTFKMNGETRMSEDVWFAEKSA